MTYTDEQKAEAVRLYVEVGPDEAAKQIGCSRRAIYDWLGLYSVQTKKPDERRAETEARHSAKREALREALLDAALSGASALDTTDPKGFQALAVGVGIFLDKYRLERGEATSRTITEGADDIDRSVVQLVAEMARRSETETS